MEKDETTLTFPKSKYTCVNEHNRLLCYKLIDQMIESNLSISGNATEEGVELTISKSRRRGFSAVPPLQDEEE